MIPPLVSNSIFTISGLTALQCLVGIGNLTEVPATSQDIEDGKYPAINAPFKRYTCGERGSQLATVDTLIKNVTDLIEQSWNSITNTLGSLAELDFSKIKQSEELEEDEKRTKRDTSKGVGEPDKDSSGEYACVKVVFASKAYRSCIPKYGDIRINCTTAVGSNVLCYCHTDDCNSGSKLHFSLPSLACFLALLMFLI
jgi:hypothetical protein